MPDFMVKLQEICVRLVLHLRLHWGSKLRSPRPSHSWIWGKAVAAAYLREGALNDSPPALWRDAKIFGTVLVVILLYCVSNAKCGRLILC